MGKFTDDEIKIIELSLERLKSDVEIRIIEAKNIIERAAEYDGYSVSIQDKYKIEQIDADLKTIHHIDKILNKI